MKYPASRAAPLHIARPKGRSVAKRIPVRQFARKLIADDLHVAMRMRTESVIWLDSIFVDDAQRAKVHVRGIKVIAEGKGVEGFQPTMIGKSSFIACTPSKS